MKNIQARIEESVEELIGSLSALVGEIAMEAVARRTHKRPVRNDRRSSKGRPHRKPEEIAALAEELHAQICLTPGETMRTLAERVKQPATLLAVPTGKLLDAGRVKKTGQRQFTRYFPVGRAVKKRARRRKTR